MYNNNIVAAAEGLNLINLGVYLIKKKCLKLKKKKNVIITIIIIITKNNKEFIKMSCGRKICRE